MPRYQKNDKIELWRDHGHQDAIGAWHQGDPQLVAVFWANFKGVDYALLYQTTGVWAKPLFSATIVRPKDDEKAPRAGDHVRHKGRFYIVRQVDDLTGAPGHDMKITCERDDRYVAPQI